MHSHIIMVQGREHVAKDLISSIWICDCSILTDSLTMGPDMSVCSITSEIVVSKKYFHCHLRFKLNFMPLTIRTVLSPNCQAWRALLYYQLNKILF